MRLVIVLFALLAVALSRPKPRSEEELDFYNWMADHKKVYNSKSEYDVRFQNWKTSKLRSEQKNKEQIGGATFGLTKFSDLTPEEFKAIYLTHTRDVPTNISSDDILHPLFTAPPTFDWRTRKVVTPVKDQGQCGSCWAFSVVENIESVWMIARRLTTIKPLSAQQIVSCDTDDSGCGGGDPPTAYEYVIKAGGLETEQSYPYTAKDGRCEFKPANIYAKITSWKYATDPNSPNEGTMRDNFASWSPLSICVDAAQWQDYTSGVFTHKQCGTNLDHCVQAVGYDSVTNPPYWIVRNSWGTSWGEQGYIRLEYGHNTCGLTDEATTAVA